MVAEKNSLVANINRRKRAGTSRPKARSTISKESYERMQEGWPKKSKKNAVRRKKKSVSSRSKTAKRRKRA